MAQLQKIIKVTQEQYNTLKNGGTVGSYKGIDSSFIYLVEEDENVIKLNGVEISSYYTEEQGQTVEIFDAGGEDPITLRVGAFANGATNLKFPGLGDWRETTINVPKKSGTIALTSDIPNPTLTKTTAKVVTDINAGSGSFTPTTKYLRKTTSNVTHADHTHSVTVGGTTNKNSGTGVTVLTGVDKDGTTTALTGVKVTAQPTVSLTANTNTATGRIKYVESISEEGPTLSGTTTFVTGYNNFSGGEGSFSGSRSTSGSGTSARRTLTLSHSHTAASLGTASTGTVSINEGSYTPTIKYLSASASGTAVGADGTATVLTGVKALGTVTVAPNEHTHTYSATSTSSPTGQASTLAAITGLTVNTTKADGDITYLESATHSHTGASVKTTEDVIKTVELN